jgi:hypothetical protein
MMSKMPDKQSPKNFPFVSLDNEAEMKKLAPNVWHALDRMRSGGSHSLGRKVFEGIKAYKIPIVEKPIWAAGLFSPNNGQRKPLSGKQGYITLNPQECNQYEMLISHEFFHSYQHIRHGLLTRPKRANLKSSILQSRLLVAGAESFAVATCFDMKHNGDPCPFRAITANEENETQTLFFDFERAVNKNLNSGKGYWQSLLDASAVNFHSYLNNPVFASDYAEREIESYGKKIVRGAFNGTMPRSVFAQKALNGDTAAMAGEFSGYKMVNKVKLPTTSDELFLGNVQLRQLADWTEYQRLAATLGAESSITRYSKRALERDENPYKDISLTDIFTEAAVRKINRGQEFRNTILDIANKLSATSGPRSIDVTVSNRPVDTTISKRALKHENPYRIKSKPLA